MRCAQAAALVLLGSSTASASWQVPTGWLGATRSSRRAASAPRLQLDEDDDFVDAEVGKVIERVT